MAHVQSAQRNLLPDIRDMLAISLTPAAGSDWMTSANDALGTTPAQALADGRFHEVYVQVLALGPQT